MSPLHVAAERGRFYHIVGHLTRHDEEAINIQDNNGVNVYCIYHITVNSRTSLHECSLLWHMYLCLVQLGNVLDLQGHILHRCSTADDGTVHAIICHHCCQLGGETSLQ